MASATHVAGWGRKPSGRRAERRAEEDGLLPLFLEDGFQRSFGTGEHFPPLSIVVDRLGIYYDCTRSSTIEDLLNSETDLLVDIVHEVSRARSLIFQHHLSKYNHAPSFDLSVLGANNHKRVLVVDQTAGDLSISLGGASAETFQHMLEAARTENPEATVYVKTHPETVSGRKGGHYSAVRDDQRTVVLRDAINPLSLIEHMDRVYVVSSTMGFEALLAGKAVTCFGMPWYAGWGATDDRLSCPRRTRKRSLDELFAAGYFHYARYLDPETGNRGTIFDVMKWLIRQKETMARLRGDNYVGRLICIGFRKWKQRNLQQIFCFQPGETLFVADAEAARKLSPGVNDQLLWWGSEAPPGVLELAKEYGTQTLRMEDGFIRSVGLGSDLIPPLSLVLDDQGIYFDPRSPSRLESILLNERFGEEELEEAREVRRLIVTQGVTKYNMEPRGTADWPTNGRRIILVPGQVEDDASIRFGCSNIRTNNGLLEAARSAAPDSFIVYKPHPDVTSGNRRGQVSLRKAMAWADHIETELSVVSCIDACDEVHTMTSLTGFDALLREKKVVTYGQPFYAGWGLTEDRDTEGAAIKRRTRQLSLDELVAGTLLRYPLYWDPVLKGYTTCKATIRHIVETRTLLEERGELHKLRAGYVRRQLRKIRTLARAWLARRR